jgi:hypothetical protein
LRLCMRAKNLRAVRLSRKIFGAETENRPGEQESWPHETKTRKMSTLPSEKTKTRVQETGGGEDEKHRRRPEGTSDDGKNQKRKLIGQAVLQTELGQETRQANSASAETKTQIENQPRPNASNITERRCKNNFFQ